MIDFHLFSSDLLPAITQTHLSFFIDGITSIHKSSYFRSWVFFKGYLKLS